jgi:RNA polymerase sigma factor (sigma-70 family)
VPNSWPRRYVRDFAAFPAAPDPGAANGREHAELVAFVWGMVGDRPEARTLPQACATGVQQPGACGTDRAQLLRRYRVVADLCLRSFRPRQRARRYIRQAIAALLRTGVRGAKPAERQAPDERSTTALRRALDSIRPPSRAVLLLRECFGLSYAEVGWVLGVPRGEVARMLYSARVKLLQRVPTPGRSADAGGCLAPAQTLGARSPAPTGDGARERPR